MINSCVKEIYQQKRRIDPILSVVDKESIEKEMSGSGNLVGVGISVGCSRFGLYVCTRVHLLGQHL